MKEEKILRLIWILICVLCIVSAIVLLCSIMWYRGYTFLKLFLPVVIMFYAYVVIHFYKE
jgi:hypothetical protein